MSRSESSKNAGFKKRSLRPWKPALLETNALLQEEETPAVEDEVPPEFFQKQLETLEVASQQQAELHTELQKRASQFKDKRITVGGFFQPNNIVFLNEQDPHQPSNTMLSSLKEKELEILSIHQQLKLTQALEQIKHLEGQLQAEDEARHAAEEKVVSAIRQAHQATVEAQQAKEKAYLAEQRKIKLQNSLLDLETQLGNLKKYQRQEIQSLKQALERANETKRLETELRQFIEDDLRKANEHVRVLEIELQKKSEALAELHSTLNKTQVEIVHSNDRTVEQNQRLTETTEALARLEQKYAILQSQHEHVLDKHSALEADLAQERTLIQEKMREHQAQLEKINLVMASERELRTMYGNKLKNALTQMSALERKIQAEEQARRSAENFASQRIEQAGRAFMQILNANVSP